MLPVNASGSSYRRHQGYKVLGCHASSGSKPWFRGQARKGPKNQSLSYATPPQSRDFDGDDEEKSLDGKVSI